MKQYSLLLACDLDRTIFPNGPEPFSENAKVLFTELLTNKQLCLTYVSGRSLNHALRGIKEFDSPLPDIYIGDVGTSMYIRNSDDTYTKNVEWQSKISSDWNTINISDIDSKLSNITKLTLQEDEHQNALKRSYYFPADEEEKIVKEIKEKLSQLEIKYELISHVDNCESKGYIDIIPNSANKEHALRYLQEDLSIPHDAIIYAGDGGNDLAPLTSGYKAIVVNNATQNFKEKVTELAKKKNVLEKIYFAKGTYKELNGNYTAGILEGLNHFGLI